MKKLAFLFVVLVMGLQACSSTTRVYASDGSDAKRPLVGEKSQI
jgi:hypothetical protein